MQESEKLVKFKGGKVQKKLRDAYMYGYLNPWKANPYSYEDKGRYKYYNDGQAAARLQAYYG